MKKYTFAPLLFLPMLTACFPLPEEDAAVIDPANVATLHVETRASEGSPSYPVLVLAYDQSGSLRAQQLLQHPDDELVLTLSADKFHLTALSGYGGYTVPQDYKLRNSKLSVPAAGYASEPLMMGGTDLQLGAGKNTVSLMLSYRVASLHLQLDDVPADVTDVSVCVSPQFAEIDMAGALSGQKEAMVPCVRSGGLWVSPTFYVLPSAGASTTLTLSLTRGGQQQSYGYQLGEALQAAVPYVISGTYVESTAPYITGVLTMEGWEDEHVLSFEFGSGVTPSGGGGTVTNLDMQVDELPAPLTMLDGHVVALVSNVTAEEADVLLLSKKEYTDIHSPAASNYPNQLWEVANAYCEGLLSGWSVPTVEQAKALRKAYAGNYEDLNRLLAGSDQIAEYTTSDNARWLCEDGLKTYTWKESSSITTAGSTVKYRLRLVKSVHVQLR